MKGALFFEAVLYVVKSFTAFDDVGGTQTL